MLGAGSGSVSPAKSTASYGKQYRAPEGCMHNRGVISASMSRYIRVFEPPKQCNGLRMNFIFHCNDSVFSHGKGSFAVALRRLNAKA